MAKQEFLPRNHPAEYGNLDISNWKDLRLERNRKRIDSAIQNLIQVLNDRGFRTFSSCSGGHKRNLNYSEADHEPGYVGFSPASGIAYKLYFALRNKYRHFEFDALTRATKKRGSEWVEVTQLDWQLERTRTSKRVYYYELFEDMLSIVERFKPTSKGLRFSEMSKMFA